MVKRTPFLTKFFQRRSNELERERVEKEIQRSKQELVNNQQAIRSGTRLMENMSNMLKMVAEAKHEK